MERVIKLLQTNHVFVATISADGRPRVRPFALMLEQDGQLYFCTSTETSAFADLKSNPYIALSAVSADYTWVKITAKAIFTNDKKIKEQALQKEQLKKLFGTADNPAFNVFYLVDGEARLCDSDNPQEVLTF